MGVCYWTDFNPCVFCIPSPAGICGADFPTVWVLREPPVPACPRPQQYLQHLPSPHDCHCLRVIPLHKKTQFSWTHQNQANTSLFGLSSRLENWKCLSLDGFDLFLLFLKHALTLTSLHQVLKSSFHLWFHNSLPLRRAYGRVDWGFSWSILWSYISLLQSLEVNRIASWFWKHSRRRRNEKRKTAKGCFYSHWNNDCDFIYIFWEFS